MTSYCYPLTDRNVELYPQFFLELITTQLRFYMVSPQFSLLIILTMQSYKFYLLPSFVLFCWTKHFRHLSFELFMFFRERYFASNNRKPMTRCKLLTVDKRTLSVHCICTRCLCKSIFMFQGVRIPTRFYVFTILRLL